MYNHKSIDILKTFSPDEAAGFKNFLSSPYYNKSEKIIQLYSSLMTFYPDFQSQKLTKRYILQKLGYEDKNGDSTLRSLFFDLLNLEFKFLVVRQLENKVLTADNYLLKALSDKHQYGLLKREIKKVEQKIKETSDADSDYFYERYLYESYKFNFLNETQRVLQRSQALSELNQLSYSDLYLALMFLTELIYDYVNIVIYSDKYNINIKKNDTRLILKSLNIRKLINSMRSLNNFGYMIDLYHALYLAYERLNQDTYLKYRKLVRAHVNRLSQDERGFHFSRLISFCILKNNKRKSSFFRNELFKLYELFLRNEYYRDKKIDYIPHNLFRAILLSAIDLKKYEWAENFINTYHKRVQERNRMYMYYYGYAVLFLERGMYEKSLMYLAKMKSDNFIFKYDIYNLKLRAYYEHENSQKTLDLLDSYKQFLRKDRFFSEDKKIPHRNFAKYLTYIIKLSEGIKNYHLAEISDSLKEENVASKEWLQQKVNSLEKRRLQKYIMK